MKQSENIQFSVSSLLLSIYNESKNASKILTNINNDIIKLSLANSNNVMNSYSVKSEKRTNEFLFGENFVITVIDALNRSILSNIHNIFNLVYQAIINVVLKLGEIVKIIKNIIPKIGNKGEPDDKSNKMSNDLLKLAENTAMLKKVITKPFLFNFNRFIDLYERFVNVGGKRGPLNGITKFALALSLLVLVVASIGEINWANAGIIIAFILSIGAAIALVQKMTGVQNKTITRSLDIKKQTSFESKGMFGFAIGLAILILTIAATSELDWVSSLKLIGFIIAVGLAVAAPGLITKGKGKNAIGGLPGFAFGIALLVLVVAATAELNWTPAIYLLLFMGGVVGILNYMNKTSSGKQTLINIGILSAFLTMSTLAMLAIKNININLGELVVFGLGVMMFVGMVYIVDKFKNNLTSGSFVMGVMSAGLLLFAVGMKQISETNIVWQQAMWFVIFAGILIGLSAILTVAAPAVAIGSGVLLILGISLITFSAAMLLISSLNISTDNVSNFVTGISMLAIGLAKLTIPLLAATVAAGLAIIVGTSTLIVATSLMMIQALKIEPSKVKIFGNSLVLLVDSYNKIGLVSLTKAAAKSLLLVPIIAASVGAALVFKAISKLNIPKDSMYNFGILMNDFIFYTTEAINSSLPALKNVEPGLIALSRLVSVGGNLLDIVDAYANMKIGVWKYNDSTGKMELVSYKPIPDSLLPKVGEGIGKLLQSLIKPLTIISSDDEYWLFGKQKIRNPFKGGFFGDRNKGVKRIEKIGNAFNTLTGFFNAITPNTEADNRSPINIMGDMINMLSDDEKWNKIHKNLDSTGKNMEKIVSNINKLDIEKATALERNLNMFAENNTIEGIKDCVEKLKELIDLIKLDNKTNINTSDVKTVSTITPTNNIEEKTKQIVDITNIEMLLGSIVDKLDDTLNVKVMDNVGGLQI